MVASVDDEIQFFDLRRKVYYTLIIDSRFIDQMFKNFSPDELEGSK